MIKDNLYKSIKKKASVRLKNGQREAIIACLTWFDFINQIESHISR